MKLSLQLRTALALGLVLVAGARQAAMAGTPIAPDPTHIPFTLPNDIKWRAASGGIAEIASLFGDSGKPGPYGVLVHYFPNKFSAVHSHSTDRNIYVVSGTWWVGSSDTVDPDKAYPMPAGSYVTDIANTAHWDGAKDEGCVLVIFGLGPMTSTQLGKKS